MRNQTEQLSQFVNLFLGLDPERALDLFAFDQLLC